jgi:sigma-B regulation protein RsbU (phosphoserine phosphatase)
MRGERAIGTIFVRRSEVRPLTDRQIELIVAFADQAAIVIENMRLLNEIQEKSRLVEEQAKELAEWNAVLETRVAEQVDQIERLSKLELELSLAGEIQKSMLPRSIPRLEGYEFSARMIPAKSVGGDFFDFIPLGDDLMGIAVGDVSDKGIPAALFMAMARSLLRAEAHPGRSPKKVLRSVSRHLMDMNDKDMFVTVLFGILNRATHQFHYARAGHEAPIFIDGRGLIKRLPRTNGQALGVFDEIAFDEQTVELAKGCMLLAYSDGIPEATNRQNVSFGYEGVVRTVGQAYGSSAQTVCDELIRAVAEHQAGSLQDDDMTVVVVQAV